MCIKKSVNSASPKACANVELIEMSSTIVAQALTNYEFSMFKAIRRSDFARSKKPLSITRMIDHFNKVIQFKIEQIAYHFS